ncbi:3-beta hydroxysteroid dehydrogenase/isomerase [Trichoderma simmonsii]|uniref:3-beta hydroxysteroid dehydrogenase/isomerase n=1 Tax=Trichoderma simmonsii TaxID=1491479 RepID=A0A8G0PJC2_9HYPO|nr:3-beta hydroxysteroid dehydrogenase/isomerase [Trichoderma simmonsii]
MSSAKHDIASQKLLITGVTGFIGFKSLLIALERGYAIRAVIRNEQSISQLEDKSTLISEGHKKEILEFVVIPDFLACDSWPVVLDGITRIIHIASPLAHESDDYERDIISPAISMVTTVLEAAANVPSVRRIVITSSCVTLIPFEWNMAPNSEILYSASDINSDPQKPYGSAMEAYWASKAYSRIATREFIEKKKPHFDFVHLLPSVVFGPDGRIPSNGSVDELLKDNRAAVLAPALDGSTNSSFPFVGVPVHVADVARAHVDAVDSARIPGNTEYILSSDTPEGVVWDRDVAAVAKKYFLEEVQSKLLPLEGTLPCIKWRLDGDATEKAFGWKFISFEQTMKELLEQYLKLKQNASQ